MRTDKLDTIWNDAPEPQRGSEEPLQIVRRELARERRHKLRMGIVGFNLTLVTAIAIWATFAGRSQAADSWPAWASLIALWATYIEFIRASINRSARFHVMGEDLQSALRLTLEKTLASSREIRILLAVNLLTVIPMTIASVQNLIGSGKMSSREALSFGIFCTIVLGANIAFLAIQYFARLRPRSKLLQRRIRSLAS